MEPFVVSYTSTLSIVQAILRSMNFQLDKKTKYDPKNVISQRKESCKLGTYEHQEDEELEAKANHNYIEQFAEKTNSEQRKDKELEIETLIGPTTGIPTSFKDERSLKRSVTKMTDMEVDVTTKRPRVSNQDKETVTLDDDEEESINQIQGFPIEEEFSHSKGVSHSISTSERTISQVVMTEQKSKPTITTTNPYD